MRITKRRIAIGLVLAGLLGFASMCSMKASNRESYAPQAITMESPKADSAAYGRAAGGMPSPAAQAPPPPPGAPRDVSGEEDTRDGDKNNDEKSAAPHEAQQAPKPARMLHYNAYARLRVDSPRKAGDEAAKIATDAGGFVEQLTSGAVTLRIPVDRFRAVLAQLLKLGDVLDKAITAQDVTDAFAAIELRLQTAKTSRDRLIALLAKAKTEREKLDLLREIQRLTQQIDDLENASKTLVSLASYSRISLALEERARGMNAPADEPVAAFQWIHRLSAFRRDVAFEGKKLKLEVPQGFVQLDDKQHFVAESADAAVFWSSKRENKPEGTTRFWVDALKSRLQPEFASVEEKTAGAFTVLRFVDRSDTPYRYLVGVRADKDDLEVIEAHFPSEEQEKRYADAVLAAIGKGAL
ncbi:MAG: DUF4349 domain-containing protein [Deltaproteobacteria bacterium]|nr:DUF4349 domain-containing protein [Deltaproteobacteria bacterium]